LKITEGPILWAYTLVLFLRKAELGFFHCLEIVTSCLVLSASQKTPVQPGLVPSTGQKILVQPSWYLRPQKIPLAENRFLQTGKGAENTREKSRQCFTQQQTNHLQTEQKYKQSFSSFLNFPNTPVYQLKGSESLQV
jgi:hypothetical protein